jgi:hypothetical protein
MTTKAPLLLSLVRVQMKIGKSNIGPVIMPNDRRACSIVTKGHRMVNQTVYQEMYQIMAPQFDWIGITDNMATQTMPLLSCLMSKDF